MGDNGRPISHGHNYMDILDGCNVDVLIRGHPLCGQIVRVYQWLVPAKNIQYRGDHTKLRLTIQSGNVHLIPII